MRLLSVIYMRFSFFLIFALSNSFCWATESGVGFTRLATTDPMGGELRYAVWYPAAEPSKTVTLGAFEFAATLDAKPQRGPLPLVVISHGTVGSHLGHRNIAMALAQAGIVAVAPLHPRDNFRDSSGTGHRIVWEGRPRQLSAVIDDVQKTHALVPQIDAQRIGAFGFSLGGYSVLALLGAVPDLTLFADHCEAHAADDPVCGIVPEFSGVMREIVAEEFATPMPSLKDARVCAAVLADPLAALFSVQSLQTLADVPLQLYIPEHQDQLTARFHGARVLYATQSEQREHSTNSITVTGAQHYSFLPPFPAPLAKALPELTSDVDGFDRTAFQKRFAKEVAVFFLTNLADCNQ